MLKYLRYLFALRNSNSYIKWLRNNGVKVGKNTIVRYPLFTRIDLTRPSLITIGDNVDINKNFTIMTHDYSSFVFKNLYGEFINSSGMVNIGSNIYFGTDVIVLKGVRIGNNCIIAAGSVVVKDIPDNSVAAGVPCRVISTIDEYFEKRKKKCVEEAVEYARSIVERFGRKPVLEDFNEEFPLWCDSSNIDLYLSESNEKQLDGIKDIWLKNHKKKFKDFDEFLSVAGIKKV